MLDKIKQFVSTAFQADKNGEGLWHFERTVYWAQQLRPGADEPILVAAYAHDIERAFNQEPTFQSLRSTAWNDPEHLSRHQERGASIIRDFLVKDGYTTRDTDRVYNMILKHEVGGDPESDLIKDADSLSYLETNAHLHVQKLVGKLGATKVR